MIARRVLLVLLLALLACGGCGRANEPDSPRRVAALGTSHTLPVATAPRMLLEQGGPAAFAALRESSLELRFGDRSLRLNGPALLDLAGLDPERPRPGRPSIDPEALRRLIGRTRLAAVERPALPARYLVDADEDDGIRGIVPGTPGVGVDLVRMAQVIELRIARLLRGTPITTPLEPLTKSLAHPIDADWLETVRDRLTLLGAHEVRYTPAVSNGDAANILVPGRALAGQVLAPGEWFDFWEDVGPVTRKAGYRQGGAFIGGIIQPTGAFAGGICAPATALYAAAAKAGLALGERQAHTSWLTRYPLGLDATVWTSKSATRSMRFQNDTADPLAIVVRQDRGFLRVELWGVDDGRQVEIEVGPLRGRRVGPSGNYGGQVTVIRTVLDAGGRELHRDVIRSSYLPS